MLIFIPALRNPLNRRTLRLSSKYNYQRWTGGILSFLPLHVKKRLSWKEMLRVPLTEYFLHNEGFLSFLKSIRRFQSSRVKWTSFINDERVKTTHQRPLKIYQAPWGQSWRRRNPPRLQRSSQTPSSHLATLLLRSDRWRRLLRKRKKKYKNY